MIVAKLLLEEVHCPTGPGNQGHPITVGTLVGSAVGVTVGKGVGMIVGQFMCMHIPPVVVGVFPVGAPENILHVPRVDPDDTCIQLNAPHPEPAAACITSLCASQAD